METITMILAIAICCVVVYITARLIFMAYFTARSAYIKELVKIAMDAKELKGNG